MKLRHLFYAAAALLPLAIACNKQENPEDQAPSIKATPSTVEFEAAAGSKTVDIEATRDWTVASKPEWVEVTPSSGKASMSAQTVTLTVLSNSGNDHEGSIVFSSGLVKTSVKVSQKGEAGELLPGSGTKEDPYTVMGVLAYLNTLGNNVESPEVVYVKGIVSNVVQDYTYNVTETDFGNARFYMKDAATDEKDFYCYNIMYLGNKKFEKGQTDVKVGDNVIICGKVVNYSGTSGKVTPETVNKTSYLYSLNGTVVEPQTEFEEITIAEFISRADVKTEYIISGKVTSVTPEGKYYGTTITDGTNSIDCAFPANWNDWKSKVAVGGTLKIRGKYELYNDKHEISNGTILSFEEGQVVTVEGSVSDAVAAEDASKIVLKDAVVAALTTKGFVVTDGTANCYVYADAEPTVKIGDKVNLNAEKTTYYELPELTKPTGITVLSSDNNVPRTSLTDISASIDTYSSKAADYITLTGKLVKSDSYYNISVAGKEWIGSASLPIAAISSQLEALVNRDVKVTGYFNTKNNGKKIVNIIVTEVAAASAYYCYAESGNTIKVNAEDTGAEIKIKANAAWTLTASEGATVNPASGDTDATVAVSFAANESTDADKVYTLTLACAAASVSQTITITQSKVINEGDQVVLAFDFSTILTGWPAKKDEAGSASTCTYSLDGVNYTFQLDPLIYFGTYSGKSYLMFASKTAEKALYMGLPAVEGYKLTGVKVKTSGSASKSATGLVSSDQNGTVVSGGTEQALNDVDKEFEWTLTGTEAGKVYYYCSSNAKYNSQITSLTLTYSK